MLGHHTMEVLSLGSCAAAITHSSAVSEDALDGAPVEAQQQLLWELSLFKLPGEEESLLGLLIICEVLAVHVSCSTSSLYCRLSPHCLKSAHPQT